MLTVVVIVECCSSSSSIEFSKPNVGTAAACAGLSIDDKVVQIKRSLPTFAFASVNRFKVNVASKFNEFIICDA